MFAAMAAFADARASFASAAAALASSSAARRTSSVGADAARSVAFAAAACHHEEPYVPRHVP